MGSRVPAQNYHDLTSANSYLEGPLHDLNADGSRQASEIDVISDVDREAVSQGSLEHDADSNAVERLHDSYQNSLKHHGVGVEEGCSGLESNGSLKSSFGVLTINDVSPVETARARFLQIVVDYFIAHHVNEVFESKSDYRAEHEQDKLHKRKTGEVQYEGDPRHVLPLMYVANMYETLVNEVNARLATLNGFREKTIGVALEAAGGLYRMLAKKFPKKGRSAFKRRELATSLETRTRFPELVVQEEKRVRFVVVNGLEIVEKPDRLLGDDAEWFKKLTGRSEVSISAQDYKFYSPRHKYRRVVPNPSPNIPGLPSYSGADSSSPMSSPHRFRSLPENQNQQHIPPQQHITPQQHTPPKEENSPLMHQPQFDSIHQDDHEPLHNSQTASHFSHDQCVQPSRLPDVTQTHPSPPIAQNMASLHSLAESHAVGRVHIMPTSPAKFCDECGTPYFRETSKFCSECGTKRLGI